MINKLDTKPAGTRLSNLSSVFLALTVAPHISNINGTVMASFYALVALKFLANWRWSFLQNKWIVIAAAIICFSNTAWSHEGHDGAPGNIHADAIEDGPAPTPKHQVPNPDDGRTRALICYCFIHMVSRTAFRTIFFGTSALPANVRANLVRDISHVRRTRIILDAWCT